MKCAHQMDYNGLVLIGNCYDYFYVSSKSSKNRLLRKCSLVCSHGFIASTIPGLQCVRAPRELPLLKVTQTQKTKKDYKNRQKSC